MKYCIIVGFMYVIMLQVIYIIEKDHRNRSIKYTGTCALWATEIT